MLHEMQSRGVVPLALVLNSVNPILAQGAALGDVAMLAGFDEDITAAIPHDAEVEVNPRDGHTDAVRLRCAVFAMKRRQRLPIRRRHGQAQASSAAIERRRGKRAHSLAIR